MATNLTCSLSAPIRASLESDSRKPDPTRRKTASSASSANWWTPLFGWSSDADYINNKNERKHAEATDPDADSGRNRSKFAPGCFTEEKAKQLRKKTAESSSFHDLMYHSAIASRLATDASVWPEK
ncbi:hypothetical protein LWI28_026717 [Acer negundo]|uniref:Uncharacterized protein n=1 Tax=Acer negundo TaxID=4023 RepID=A0AAD5IHL7_ACENE|nr:hypothetical protein LWI28_026717 [Acer negundo]